MAGNAAAKPSDPPAGGSCRSPAVPAALAPIKEIATGLAHEPDRRPVDGQKKEDEGHAEQGNPDPAGQAGAGREIGFCRFGCFGRGQGFVGHDRSFCIAGDPSPRAFCDLCPDTLGAFLPDGNGQQHAVRTIRIAYKARFGSEG